MNEHDYEPVPGLPALLPSGETILWQGTPKWTSFARRALWTRWLIGYFTVIIVWVTADQVASGRAFGSIAMSAMSLCGLAAAAVGLLLMFAWFVARTTLYTITSRRVVMRIGVALPMTIQIPFVMIDAAGVKAGRNGSGDIALTLVNGQRIAYLMLWPHARPWKISRPQPAFRGLEDVALVALILGQALTTAAARPAKIVKVEATAEPDAASPVPAAA
jgi:hypothetical protein